MLNSIEVYKCVSNEITQVKIFVCIDNLASLICKDALYKISYNVSNLDKLSTKKFH